MINSAAAVARVKEDVEQTLGLMRTQMAAFRRMAAPEVMAAYPRITAAIGREDFLVSGERTKAGLRELMDEADLLAWEVPHLLEELFTEKWMQACFTANDVYPDTIDYHLYDYLRGRGRTESPFPEHFGETLHRALHPLGRLLHRSGYKVGIPPRQGNEDGRPDPPAFARLGLHFKMQPTMISGAIAFGEQARHCHQLRQSLKELKPKLAAEQARALWDEIEAERKKSS